MSGVTGEFANGRIEFQEIADVSHQADVDEIHIALPYSDVKYCPHLGTLLK